MKVLAIQPRTFALPMALNELHGVWTLAARDAASGVKAAVQVTVK